jgi:hypothetical protein
MSLNQACRGLRTAAIAFLGIASAQSATAGYAVYSGVSIQKLRVVGDYQGTTFDNTLEVWPTTPLPPSASNCTSTYKFYIDSKHRHLVAAVYLALASGKKIEVTVDDALPVREGACEAAYLDISGQ